jgi:hypothetical protein
MKKILKFANNHKENIVLLAIILFIQLPSSPFNMRYSFRDPGVFLYSGWRLLNGEVPYIGFWDHKPPLIYLINSIGLFISGNSTWGVWFIESFFLFLASITSYKLIKKMFGFFPAILGTFLWLMTCYYLVEGGNYTTEYTIPFQFLSLIIFFYSINNNKTFNFFIIGIFGGIAFFLKPTSIGVWVSIIIYLLISSFQKENMKSKIIEITSIIIGFLCIFILISIYFLKNNAFYEFIDSVFVYNFYYSTQNLGFRERLWNLINFSPLRTTGIISISALAIPLIIFELDNSTEDKLNNNRPLLIIILIDFLIEWMLINLPGKSYIHYYLTLMPSLAIFSSYLFWIIDSQVIKSNNNKMMKNTVYLLIFALMSLLSIRDYKNTSNYLNSHQADLIISFIQENSREDDYILLWGAESAVNFHSKRVSPSKYFYQYPLFKPGFTSEGKIIKFLDDIIINEPKFIIDTNREDYPFFEFPINTTEIMDRIEIIRSNYKEVGIIDNWVIYEEQFISNSK